MLSVFIVAAFSVYCIITMLVPCLLSQAPDCPHGLVWRGERVRGSLAPCRLQQSQGYLGLPCLLEHVYSVDTEIIPASGRPASAKLLQHSLGPWWFLVPKS